MRRIQKTDGFFHPAPIWAKKAGTLPSPPQMQGSVRPQVKSSAVILTEKWKNGKHPSPSNVKKVRKNLPFFSFFPGFAPPGQFFPSLATHTGMW